MDPMKSDFIIKRNKKGKSESTHKRRRGKVKKAFKSIIHFSHLEFGELSRRVEGFKRNPSRLLVSVLQ